MRRLMRHLFKLAVGAVLLFGLVTAAGADQTISWVTVSADEGERGGSEPSVSDDGRFVAFESTSPLVPGVDDSRDVFVKDMETGAVELASVSSNGTEGNGTSENADISADGRYVAFRSTATNLVAGDTNDQRDVFIHDRQTGDTTRALGTDGSQGTGSAENPAISADGRYVAFTAGGYDPSGSTGVFVFDRQAGTSERVTDGVEFTTSGHYEDPDISDDGRYVAFITREFNSQNDIILFDRDSDTWGVANPRIGGEAPQSRMPDFSLSADGRFVTFGSPDTNYVAGDPDSNDVFVYDADADQIEKVDNSGAGVSNDPRPVISGNGRYVTFTAREDLYDAQPNGRTDVVVYDRQADAGEVVSVHDDGTPGERGSGSYADEPAISRDGRFVVFNSSWNFDPDDSALTSDLYIVDREGTSTPPSPGACTHDFTDVDSSNIFEDDICWLADQGITRGCNPPANSEFCPDDRVTRGQMAAFLVRALDYTDNGGGDLFDDDDGSTFEGDIDRLGTAGVTRGCNPPANNLFCPTDYVSRGQMAAFLVRALDYTDNGGGDLFDDDDGSTFEGDIDRLGTAGVTRGCNPPANNLFCPGDDVTREQMAAFLRRALDG